MASNSTTQKQQTEWHEQWAMFDDDTPFLFQDWISPRTLEDFRGKTVLDAGCGPGHHMRLVAPVAAWVTGVDLNAAEIARERLSHLANITVLQADLATFKPEAPFEAIYCIGVIHHTDSPDRTFESLKGMLKPGGLMVIWCYSHEGNELVRWLVEPARRLVLRHLPRRVLVGISAWITALLYPIVYSLYLLPLKSLPFYEYFSNFRQLSFRRNLLNVFDKLNAPQTDFISRERIGRWFDSASFDDIQISPYRGVSWRGSGFLKKEQSV
jgi:SAM-dependent methyltransferase